MQQHDGYYKHSVEIKTKKTPRPPKHILFDFLKSNSKWVKLICEVTSHNSH